MIIVFLDNIAKMEGVEHNEPRFLYVADALQHGTSAKDIADIAFTQGLDAMSYKPMCAKMSVEEIGRRLDERYPEMAAKFRRGLAATLPDHPDACLARVLEHGDESDVHTLLSTQGVDRVKVGGQEMSIEEIHRMLEKSNLETTSAAMKKWRRGLASYRDSLSK